MSVQDTSSNSETKAPPPSTEGPWYIRSFTKTLICIGVGGGRRRVICSPYTVVLLQHGPHPC